jgi:hypothetical protein
MQPSFTGRELFRIWEAGRSNGLTQRKLAKFLGESFNSVHGKIFREQKRETRQIVFSYREEVSPVLLKAAVFDIETMSFTAGGVRDHLVCTSILPLDAEQPVTYVLRFEDERDDRRLLEEVRAVLEDYDILIGHNAMSYDLNWINSRLIYHDMEIPAKKWLVYDTYQAARRMAIKADRKSLGFLGDFFHLDGVKTAVLPVSWGMIDSPNREEFERAMADIQFHCEQDVILTRQLFNVMWPHDKTMVSLPVFKRMI